jgi:hypothetical protein
MLQRLLNQWPAVLTRNNHARLHLARLDQAGQ